MSAPNLPVDHLDLVPKARIREAALAMYAEHGIQRTSIRMVAEAAGMSAGGVMHHFKSKEALAESVQNAVLSMIERVVGGVGLASPPDVAARERREAFDQLILDHPDIAGYFRRAQLEGGPAGLALYRESYRLMEAEMREMVDAGLARELPDPKVALVLYRALQTAHILLGPLIEEVLDVKMSEPQTLERFRAAVLDLLTRPVFESAVADDHRGRC